MERFVDLEELENNIKFWTETRIGKSFEFREYQLETIIDICANILGNVNHTQIIEAPTGSGKSLLNIISAGVLADIYGRSSYILVSDLFLWKQYEDFILQHPKIKKEFGILKGQTGNYVCAKNDLDMRNADCRMAGLSWASMFNYDTAVSHGYDCAATCKYVKERKKAVRAKVVIMTYQLYHYMINVVAKTNDKAPFPPRDIIFCDECHNIPTIVKNNFSPEIKYSDFQNLRTLHTYRGKIQLDMFADDPEFSDLNDGEEYQLISTIMTIDDVEKRFEECWDIFCDPHASSQNNWAAIKGYIDILNKYAETVMAIESNLSIKKQILHKKFDKEDTKFYKACSWYRNCMCFWNDFQECIEHTGIEYVIKEVGDNKVLKETVVNFTNVKEDFMCYYFLLGTAANRVMMSATIGGYDAFCENIGEKYLAEEFVPDEEIQYTVIPSTFDFSSSPVYFLNRYKMSFREKEQSLKSLKPIIYQMCNKHFKGKRGMIQTGSYAIAKEIYDNAPIEIQNRLLLYNNSKEKTDVITWHQMSEDTILIGPTLVEGIDLPGKQCEFIVILKVPYPVIVDEYVKRKMDLFPMWYNSTTSNIIIQGIGRGNRFKEDSCVTYILDACFLGLYNSTKDQYPKELQERIKIYS